MKPIESWKSFLICNWLQLIFVLSLLLLSIPLANSILGNNIADEQAVASERPDVFKDAAFWQWAGWRISEGDKPYQDIFEIKSPMTLLFPALLAAISGSDMVLLHFMSTLSTILMAVGTVSLVGVLVYKLTDHRESAVFGALSTLTYVTFLYRPSLGFAPKYFVLFFGLLSLVCVLEDRWLLAGVFSVLSTSFWQFGLIFPLVVLAKSIHRFDDFKFVIGGMLSATLAVFLPLILTGTLTNMIVGAIISPLSTSGSDISIFNIFWHMKYSLVLFLLIFVGFIYDNRILFKSKWLLAVSLWFGGQLLFMDYDGFIDLITLMPVLAIYSGISFHSVSDNFRRAFSVVLSLLLVLSLLGGGLGVFYEEYKPLDSGDGKGVLVEDLQDFKNNFLGQGDKNTPTSKKSEVYDPFNEKLIFWGMKNIESCYVMRGGQQSRWIAEINKTENATQCGEIGSLSDVIN